MILKHNFKQETDSKETLAGRICKIQTPEDSREDSGRSLVVIKQFDVSSVNDDHFGMPILTGSGRIELVPVKVRSFY